eukprot:COSAG02_NODE_1835_length_10714_cov_7.585437_5_plen_477_part_00
MRMWLNVLLLSLSSCDTLGLEPAPGGGDAEGACELDDPCCITRQGDQTCDRSNATCFGAPQKGISAPKGAFENCTAGRLYWRDWTSLDAGLLVQITRPKHSPVGPPSCAKVVITRASNALGYIGTQKTSPGSCGDRESQPTNNAEDSAGCWPWFNVTGTNTSLNRDFALLKDVDWQGLNMHITLRPNQNGNFSSNHSFFDFKIAPCKVTGMETDTALEQTALVDAAAALFAFIWVTASWAFCGGVRQLWAAREERRAGSMHKFGEQGPSESLLMLRGGSASLSGTRQPGAPRTSRADTAALAQFVAAKNSVGGSTIRAKRKLERDLKDDSNNQSFHASIQQAIKIAERDIVIEWRRKQGEWRAKFMAEHRFTWPYYVWIEPDKTVAQVAGQRALEYMEFQWAIIRLLIGLSLPTLVLLGINLTGHWCEDASKGKEMTEDDQETGIPFFDGPSGDPNKPDYGEFQRPRVHLFLPLTV